jgi:hypothetical protein
LGAKKRTWRGPAPMSAFDSKQTLAGRLAVAAVAGLGATQFRHRKCDPVLKLFDLDQGFAGVH